MNNKNNILEAWIMVEHLSEGDMKLNDKELKSIELTTENDYYSMFQKEIQNKKFAKYKNHGIVLYFNIFHFDNVIKLLRDKYNLLPTEEEITKENKFSFAIYFDKELKLVKEMTFFTASYYIMQKNSVPKENDFTEFENQNKKCIEELFNAPEDEKYSDFFNHAFAKLLEKYSIQLEQSRMKVLANLETDATNLHSFFVSDLEKAKSISTNNFDKYILGKKGARINLDSKIMSNTFNPEIFKDILQPKYYPVSRFPSEPKYALSFMQQVAVNLAIGYDNEQIRSVNGPPGTGKTTLLKDIFAELIVKQAYEISRLSNKVISDSNQIQYNEKYYIGIIPNNIADKGIVVASSNNGAVQNIVNELPLIEKIDRSFVEELREADYFWEISNSKISTEWGENESGNRVENLISEPCKEEKCWGLFSLEGGKKDNMDYIITALKHVFQNLEKEYKSNDDVYKEFLDNYQKVDEYKKGRQAIAEMYVMLEDFQRQYADKINRYNDKIKQLDFDINTLENDIFVKKSEIQTQIEQLEALIQNSNSMLTQNAEEKANADKAIETLKLQKPGLFAGRQAKRVYAERKNAFSEQLLDLLKKEKEIKQKKSNYEAQIQGITGGIKDKENQLADIKKMKEETTSSYSDDIQVLAKNIDDLTLRLQGYSVNKLDMNVDYDNLQLSNPWFDTEYRILQSKLFIAALKVRKQFLYENRRSIRAAYIIWSKQKDYLDNKQLIGVSWDWINTVIPVISSTFASFSRMCANLETNSLGHLFVDEAGQALPQASVGAIFRSNHVMVVGDPAQIKPVLTLDSKILEMLGKYYGVSSNYLSDEVSTQTLVDDISKYGYYKTQDEWIGIPLWVHRRCKNPMFQISNAISYGGNMVQSNYNPGKACWYHITGTAVDKYVKEQGTFLSEKISELAKENPDILDKSKKDVVYVITPFSNVAFQLSKELGKIGFTRYDKDGKATNVGTVHTFQGKEAPIVFFVLGCDEKNGGAASWAVGTENPNIMNVAATRAKEEFYIIGDQQLFMSINSDVIKDTVKVLEKFNKQ